MKNALKEKLRAFRARHPSRLNRKQKTVRNVVCLLLLLVLGYRLAGCPPLSAMHAFRQAERQALAGPSEVIARIPGENISVLQESLERFGDRNFFGDLSTDWLVFDLERTREYIVGERGGTLYCFQYESRSDYWLSHRSYLRMGEKTSPVTVLCTGRYYESGTVRAVRLCVRAELSEAVYAFAETRSVRGDKDSYYVNRCSGEGTVYGDGVFIIAAYQCAEPEETTQEEYEAMEGLMEVRLVLKDAAGNVIYDETHITE